MALLETAPNAYFTATYRPGSASMPKRQAILERNAKPLAVELTKTRDLIKLTALAQRIVWMAAPDTRFANDPTLKKLVLFSAARSRAWGKTPTCITYISTTGVYGNAGGEWINERAPVNPQSDRAKRRVHAEMQLKFGLKLAHKIHILRAPGIYGHGRLPIDRIRAGTPALLPQEDSWSNHIHEVDLARLAFWANFKAGTYKVVNACDEAPCKMGDYFDAVADAFGLQRPPRLSREEVKKVVSPMMWSFMAESRRIESNNQKSLGFRLRYPTVADYLLTRTSS